MYGHPYRFFVRARERRMWRKVGPSVSTRCQRGLCCSLITPPLTRCTTRSIALAVTADQERQKQPAEDRHPEQRGHTSAPATDTAQGLLGGVSGTEIVRGVMVAHHDPTLVVAAAQMTKQSMVCDPDPELLPIETDQEVASCIHERRNDWLLDPT